MKLVIVESPSKAKTIQKYLGKGYKVVASVGHVADLPKSVLGVDVDNDFQLDYEFLEKKSVTELKKAYKEADEVVLALDMDREGEAIAWHVARLLKLINDKGSIIDRGKGVVRIVFSEITPEAVKEAIEHPRDLDMNLVNAQQARRALDRIVGYKLSPLLWKKIRFGLSAGRVQSAAVRLIVKREEERDAFNQDEYWDLVALLDTKPASRLETQYSFKDDAKAPEATQAKTKLLPFTLKKINGQKADINDCKTAEKIVSELEQQKWFVTNIESKEITRKSHPPFTTSTLQQAAVNRLGLSSRETMRIAQKLYEAGLISYMRTDSVYLAGSAIDKIRGFVKKQFGQDYLPAQIKVYAKGSKLAQEAHEAIRPTDIQKKPEALGLSGREEQLYKLIWQRTLASQMQDATLRTESISLDVAKYTFGLSGQKVLFSGFLAAYDDHVSEVLLPNMKIGQELFLAQFKAGQHFTQPPARYSEASLIKALELLGIGRPSTYAAIISTIQVRKYVEKLGKYFMPTDVGKVVDRLLVKHFPKIVDTDFTADVEARLDNVAEGELDWVKMLREFYKPFASNLEDKELELKREDFTVLEKSDHKCPECGKKMVVKLGKFGKFISCADFPKCKGMMSMDGKTEADVAKEAYSADFLKVYKAPPKTDDGRDFLLKVGRYGKFWAHPDYPKVKDARALDYTDEIFGKLYGKTPKSSDGKKMVLRRGKFGEFWAHPDYPEKKEVVRINKKELEAKKAELDLK